MIQCTRLWCNRALALLALLLCTGATALAAVPAPPTTIYHAAWSPDTFGVRTISISWLRDAQDSASIDGFYVYQRLDSGMATRITPDTMDSDADGGSAHISVARSGTYTYYVTAYNADGESAASPEAGVVLAGEWVNFTEAVEYDTASNNTPYTRTFAAVSSTGEAVRYSTSPGFDGWGGELPAAIDAATGVFSTTPMADGHYSFAITAYLPDDSAGTVTTLWFTLETGRSDWGGDVCAVIRGTVRDSAGNPVQSGYVTAVPRNYDGYLYYTGLVENGEYELPVSAGDFAVVYEDEYFLGYQFYENTDDFFEATPVVVDCSDTATADFTVVAPVDTTAYITVSGYITRAADNSPVEAEVLFFVSDAWGYVSLSALADENGYYEVELPVALGPWRFSYTAMALPFESDLYWEYFDGGDGTINSGEALVIDASRSDVHFALGGMPVMSNSLEGLVTDEYGTPVDATIFVYPSTYQGDATTPYYTMTQTIYGTYALYNLQPGSYVLVAVPVDSRLAPGYFAGQNQAVVMNWENAELFVVDSSTTLLYADMVLPVIDAEGINVVHGTTSGSGGAVGKGEQVQSSTPLPGTLIYALDEHDAVVGYAVSGRDGSFRIARLGTGNFRLYADKAGFLGSESSLAFEQPGTRKNVHLTLSAMATTDVGEARGKTGVLSVWPNPASSVLVVRIPAFAGTARLALSDITGRELLVQDIAGAGGEQTVRVDVGTLSAGMYRLVLASGGAVHTTPVTIAR